MILETIAASLIPVGIEGVKSAITKFFGGVQPNSIEDVVKLNDSVVSKLKALAELDNPYGTPSQWVIDLRASSRYIGALAGIVGGIAISLYSTDSATQAIGLEVASICFGFLFGSRIVANYKK